MRRSKNNPHHVFVSPDGAKDIFLRSKKVDASFAAKNFGANIINRKCTLKKPERLAGTIEDS